MEIIQTVNHSRMDEHSVLLPRWDAMYSFKTILKFYIHAHYIKVKDQGTEVYKSMNLTK